jgi:hypothetical protein
VWAQANALAEFVANARQGECVHTYIKFIGTNAALVASSESDELEYDVQQSLKDLDTVVT